MLTSLVFIKEVGRAGIWFTVKTPLGCPPHRPACLDLSPGHAPAPASGYHAPWQAEETKASNPCLSCGFLDLDLGSQAWPIPSPDGIGGVKSWVQGLSLTASQINTFLESKKVI